MKIIFLDIDGVLNSAEFAERHYNETGKGLFMTDFLDPDAVERMKRFFEEHEDVKFVLDSSWRYGNYVQTLNDLENTGLKPLLQYMVGVTIRSYERIRGKEIRHFIETMGKDESKKLWKDETPFIIEKYVIVDDDADMLDEQLPFFVHTDNYYGITEDDYKKIEEILYEKQ